FELFFWSGSGILVSALPVFAVGQEVPPAERSFSAFDVSGTRGSLVRQEGLVGGEPGVPARLGGRDARPCTRELSFTYPGATIPIDEEVRGGSYGGSRWQQLFVVPGGARCRSCSGRVVRPALRRRNTRRASLQGAGRHGEGPQAGSPGT